MCDFNHLHCHTQFSLLDGAARIRTLVDKAAEFEMSGLAITDHGNLFGVPEFYTAARKAGVKPVIGCEFYITPGKMQDRTERTRFHQVLFAKDETGYRNLIKLSSLSFTEGYYYKPRIDRQALRTFSEGLIATTCCLQGEVLQTILARGEEAARNVFEFYLDIFGKDYYVEIQDHGIADQRKCNAVLLRWASEYGVEVVATNDVHYVEQEDAAAQDVLLCLQTGKDFADPNRMRFENDQFYLKSKDEMRASLADLGTALADRALDTTREIVDKCSLDLSMGTLLMPHYPIPEAFGGDTDAYLQHLVLTRARERYPDPGQDVLDRLHLELGIISEMGYAGYFLIVQDFTSAARRLGVRVGPGRGSAAGSAVAFCLGITNIDPLKYDLLFERFLNPERISMPDIDIDFDDRGRSSVIDYVIDKYGRENVCQIVTFGTMGARSVIRDVSRVLGIPLTDADRIARLVPEGVKMSLAAAKNEVAELRALEEHEDPQIRKLMHYAQVLEGSARHTGVHPAGVIIAPGDVSDYVPVAVARSKGDEVLTTQYDGNWVESFGLLKMDFLGLKTLTVLNDALDLIKCHHETTIDIDAVPLDDVETFKLFQRGETVAIFQFESSGMREWLRKLQPTSLDDLIAMNALYRPGPMDLIPNYIDRKHGREEIVYPHPMLEPVLKTTFGLPVYQEQVMQMAQVMGGYSLGGADLLRRAMGKKKPSEMAKQRTIFVEGARKRDVPEETAEEVFDMMAKFAGYGFNKSHSAAYSLVAYQTAYLKAHFPAAFMAAVMTNEMGDTGRLAVVLEEARQMELDVLPPSINRSHAHFTVEGECIRFGLGAIKGVGLNAIDAIAAAREKVGTFMTVFDLTRELDLRAVNKKTLESLARAGALDDLDGHRAQQVESIDLAVQFAQKVQADRAAGQNSLFGDGSAETVMAPSLPAADAWPRSRVLKEERELIGLYMSGHPLESFAAEASAFATIELGRIDDDELEAAQSETKEQENGYQRGPTHRVCGIITDVQRRTTKTGKPIAFATIEDFTGQAEIVCFSNVYDRVQHYLILDEVVMVHGEVELRGGRVKVVARDILPMWKVREQLVKSIVLRVESGRVDENDILKLRSLCEDNRGGCMLYFDLDLPETLVGTQRIRSRHFVVEPTPELMNGMARLFGKENVILQGEA